MPNDPKDEVSEEFVQGMRDRMTFSFYKYGPLRDAYPHKVNAIKSLKKRLEIYEETGNTEMLMDIANFAMIEYIAPAHENAHFEALTANEGPGRKWHAGGSATHRNNQGDR